LAFLLLFLLAAALLVAATILLPLFRALRASTARPGWRGPAYFVLIGLAFLLVEMGMMQQLSLLLGHPLYALVVVLAGLLAASGAGALASDRLLAAPARAPLAALAAAAAATGYSLLAEGTVTPHPPYGFRPRARGPPPLGP